MDLKLFFRKNLLHWNTNINKRQMPWKGQKDAYKIWLSEIILQQTRVEQGWVYYENFIATYPTIFELANAKDDDVFKLWEGLGYYSRCKNLLATARVIVEKHVGVFPTKYDDILALKGIGPYTAAAVSSFAYNLPYAVIDGNVYRVLSRFFGIETPTDSTEGKKIFTTLANDCIDKNEAGNYNQAIMDFGATVCTPALPTCTSCVLQKMRKTVCCLLFCLEIELELPSTCPTYCRQFRLMMPTTRAVGCGRPSILGAGWYRAGRSPFLMMWPDTLACRDLDRLIPWLTIAGIDSVAGVHTFLYLVPGSSLPKRIRGWRVRINARRRRVAILSMRPRGMTAQAYLDLLEGYRAAAYARDALAVRNEAPP